MKCRRRLHCHATTRSVGGTNRAEGSARFGGDTDKPQGISLTEGRANGGGKTFPRLRDCGCLSSLSAGRRRTGKVFIIASEPKAPLTAGDSLNQRLKNKTEPKKNKKLLHPCL